MKPRKAKHAHKSMRADFVYMCVDACCRCFSVFFLNLYFQMSLILDINWSFF